MRHGKMRRSLAVASATAMAGAALVAGAGVAAADAVSREGTVHGNSTLGNKLDFKRTISEAEVTYGDKVTITSELVDSYGVTWWANTHSWIENNVDPCFEYVPGTAEWKAWGGDWQNQSTKPNEFKTPSPGVIRIEFPVVVSDPLVLKADYLVKCNAGDQVATGGMSWNGTYGDSGSNYRSFGPAIKVNKATINDLFLAVPQSPTVNTPTELSVTTDAPNGSTVTFQAGTQTLTDTVSDGKATVAWTPSVAGNVTVKASIAATGTHTGISTSRVVSVAQQTVSSTLELTAPTDATAGTPVQLSATVDPAGAGGTVTFKENGTAFASGVVPSSGIVTVDWLPSAVGPRSIDAEFSGRAGVEGSTAIGKSVQVAAAPVEKEATTTTLAPLGMGKVNEAMTLEATVSTGAAGGTVKFYDGTTLLDEVEVGANGVATYQWTPTTDGERTVRAVFSGTDTALASSGAAQAVISSSTVIDPEDPGTETPGNPAGSLGSLTGSLGGGGTGGVGSLSSLGS